MEAIICWRRGVYLRITNQYSQWKTNREQRRRGWAISLLGKIVGIPLRARHFVCARHRACARVHAPVSLQRDVAFDGDKRVCPLQNARMQRFSPGTNLCSCGSWSSRPSGRRGRGPGWVGGPPGSVHSREFHDAPDRTSSSGGTCCSLSTADAARETMTRLEWGKGQKGGIKRCLTHLLLKLRGNWHSHTH